MKAIRYSYVKFGGIGISTDAKKEPTKAELYDDVYILRIKPSKS